MWMKTLPLEYITTEKDVVNPNQIKIGSLCEFSSEFRHNIYWGHSKDILSKSD